MWDNRSQYIKNHDGDTVTYTTDLGRRIYHNADIRLLGVWAPELSQPGGPETRDYVREWHLARMRNGRSWPFLVTTALVRAADPDSAEAKKTIDRYVATVVCMETNESLNLAVQAFVEQHGYVGGQGA